MPSELGLCSFGFLGDVGVLACTEAAVVQSQGRAKTRVSSRAAFWRAEVLMGSSRSATACGCTASTACSQWDCPWLPCGNCPASGAGCLCLANPRFGAVQGRMGQFRWGKSEGGRAASQRAQLSSHGVGMLGRGGVKPHQGI